MIRILVIDDDFDIVETVTFMLESRGYYVITALGGEEGLVKAKERLPDIILLDLMMPLMDGFEVCQKLKNDEDTKNIPVIILTARGDSEAHYKAFKLSADDYIVKPFNLPALIAKLNKFILPSQSSG
jgi:two-component system, OmpR family, alkaline phosphatase synthesis response regulator PhoP